MFEPYKLSIEKNGSGLLVSVIGGRLSEGINFKDAELIQYLRPVGLGPSSNTWPKWELLFFDLISIVN